MEIEKIIKLWERAIEELLNTKFKEEALKTLSLQTKDSIRRVQIFQAYHQRAVEAEENCLSYFETSNPFILSQRKSLDRESKFWYLYLATYFGKSLKSKWNMFIKTAFDIDNNLITLESIKNDRNSYFNYLNSVELFQDAYFSNHRKYTKKSLSGDKGVITSMEYVLDNIIEFAQNDFIKFDVMYRKSLNIPNFGRMAAFDYTCNIAKCKLNVDQPTSMYHANSTGPLSALKLFLSLANKVNNRKEQIKFGNLLTDWFFENAQIDMTAQVLEDAICNWQKSPNQYIYFKG